MEPGMLRYRGAPIALARKGPQALRSMIAGPACYPRASGIIDCNEDEAVVDETLKRIAKAKDGAKKGENR
jgi:hypothetical protein